MLTTWTVRLVFVLGVFTITALASPKLVPSTLASEGGPAAWAQAVGGAAGAKPVRDDPGISSMRLIDRPEFFVLRDYAEPGATRRMHSHDNAAYQVLTLITGQLRLTIEGAAPIDVTPGQAVYLKGGARHTFTNTGTVTATIVEVFGRAQPAPK